MKEEKCLLRRFWNVLKRSFVSDVRGFSSREVTQTKDSRECNGFEPTKVRTRFEAEADKTRSRK